MKNTMKLIGIIALVTLIGFAMASCTLALPGSGDDGGSGSSGGTNNGGDNTGNNGGTTGGGSTITTLSGRYTNQYNWSLIFSGSNFTAYVDGESVTGTYSISGTTLMLYGDNGFYEVMTIVSEGILRDDEAHHWFKR